MSAPHKHLSCPHCHQGDFRLEKHLWAHFSQNSTTCLARYYEKLALEAELEAPVLSDNEDEMDWAPDEGHQNSGGTHDAASGSGAPVDESSDDPGDREPEDFPDDNDEDRPRSPLTLPRNTRYHVRTYPVNRGPYVGTRWEQKRMEESPRHPFFPWASEDEYKLVEWLSTEGLSQGAIDRYLKLEQVSCKSLYLARFEPNLTDWASSDTFSAPVI